MKPMNRSRRLDQRGSTLIEFAIVTPCLLLLFFGTIGLGIMMGRYVQAVQVARDVAHMYANGVDFTQATNRNIVTQQLASGVGMTDAGGSGTVILSKVVTVYQTDCDAAGLTCTNLGLPVFTQRITIGQSALRPGDFGSPSSTILDAAGNIDPLVYITNSNSSVRTSGFEATLDDAVQRATGSAASPPAQPQGDTAYVVEVYFQYPDIGFLGWSTASGAYARFIFH
jgi:TadE-like protein